MKIFFQMLNTELVSLANLSQEGLFEGVFSILHDKEETF